MFDLYLKFKDFWPIIKIFLWVFVILLGIELFKRGFYYLEIWLKKRRTKKWLEEHKTLEEWEKVDGRKFEEIVAIIFEKLGYKTKIRVDRGIDIIAEKDGKKTFIQCKRMDKVIPDDVRAFWGSIQRQIEKGKGEGGVFVTTGSFTEGSKEFVKDKPIELIDGLELEELAKEKGVNSIFNKKSNPPSS